MVDGGDMYDCVEDALVVADRIANTPAVAGDQEDIAAGVLTDAHKYTRTLIRSDYPLLLGIDNQYFHADNPVFSLDVLLAAIREYARSVEYNAEQIANVDQVLNSIYALANGPCAGVECGETNINVPDLLLRAWNMASDLAEKRSDPSLKTQILACIEGNISDAGGCMPGIVARLYPAYARMIKYSLERILRIANYDPVPRIIQ